MKDMTNFEVRIKLLFGISPRIKKVLTGFDSFGLIWYKFIRSQVEKERA
jgi:hypothetical protein